MYILISFLSGIITALPLLFPDLYILSWFSVTPLLWLIIKKKPLYRYALFWGIGYYGISYHWFTELYPMDFAGFSKPGAIITIALCWIGLTLLQAAWIALLAPLIKFCSHLRERFGEWTAPVFAAAVFTALELCQTKTWLGVPFFRLALTQSGSLQTVQSASVFGSLFISFLIILVNGLIVLGFTENGKSKKEISSKKKDKHSGRYRKLVPGENMPKTKVKSEFRSGIFCKNLYVITAVILVVINYCFGILHIALDEKNGKTVRVALIQGNISASEKWNTMSSADTLELYAGLTEEAIEACEPQIVVWPESVINADLNYYESYKEKIKAIAADTGTIIVVGAFETENEYDGDGNRISKNYNSLYTFMHDGTEAENTYRKRKLVPFGEFIPMSGLLSHVLPLLTDMNLTGNDITPGDSTQITQTPVGRLGGLICFDSIYEELARDSVLDGAQLLILSTNDSWYGESAATRQHLAHASLRAIETGRYVVRAASTGISAVITPTGAVTQSIGNNEEGFIYGDVLMKSDLTVFDAIGDSFAYICLTVTIIPAAIYVILRIREKIVFIKNKNKDIGKVI